MTSKRVPGWVWAILVVMHLLALGWALGSGKWNFPDSDRYLQAAENLRQYGELYARPWPASPPQGQAIQEFTIRPLGYPLVAMWLGADGNRPVLLLGIQNVLSLLNIGLVLGWWARWERPTGKQWRLAIILVLSFPAQFIYANAVMSETMLQTVIIVAVGAGLAFIETPKKLYWAVIAGATGLALLLKPVFYPFAIGLFVVGIGLAWRRQQAALALIAAVPLTIVGCYMGWNQQRTGYFHFSSIAEINLLHYNAAGVVRQIDGPKAEEQWVGRVLEEAGKQPDFAARQQVIQARAGAVLWAHPMVYTRQHVQGMATMFADPGRFDVSQFLDLRTPAEGGLLVQARNGRLMQAVGRLPWGLLSVLGLVLLANATRFVLAVRGFFALKTRIPKFSHGRWLMLGLLMYVALLTGPLGAARFLVPVWPLLLGLALVGLSSGRDPGNQSHSQQAAPVRKS